MSVRLIIRAEAELDITEAAQWYQEQQAGLGVEFINEVRTAIQRVAERPLAWRLIRRKPHVRRILTHRFPYRIFYIVRKDAVIIFAAIHGKRHDRTWRKRLQMG